MWFIFAFFSCLNSCQSPPRMLQARSFRVTLPSPIWLQAGYLLAAILAVSSCEAVGIYTLIENPARRRSNLLLSLIHKEQLCSYEATSAGVRVCVAHSGSWREKSQVYIFTLIYEACYSISNHRHNAEDVQKLWTWTVCGKTGWYIRGGGKLTGAYCSKRRWRMSPWLILMMQSFSLKSRSCSAFPPGSRRFTSRPWVLEMIKW